jgi:hypothetical protein
MKFQPCWFLGMDIDLVLIIWQDHDFVKCYVNLISEKFNNIQNLLQSWKPRPRQMLHKSIIPTSIICYLNIDPHFKGRCEWKVIKCEKPLCIHNNN